MCCKRIFRFELELSSYWQNTKFSLILLILETLCRVGPRGRAREWATLGVHPLSWLLSNNRLEEVCGTLTKDTFSSRLLLSNQDKGCTPSVVLPLALPLGPALHNLASIFFCKCKTRVLTFHTCDCCVVSHSRDVTVWLKNNK